MKKSFNILCFLLLPTWLVGEGRVVQIEGVEITAESPKTLDSVGEPSSYALDRIQLETQAKPGWSLQDVLRRSSSIQVRSVGGRASASTLGIRGSTAKQVKVFVDGMPLDQGSSQAVDLSTLDLEAFEEVEVYKSHAPARFGVGAIGGVVNLIPKSSAAPMRSLRLGVGSFDFREGQWDQVFGANTIHRIQLHHQEEEGDFDYTDDNLTPDLALDDVERTRINNDFRSTHLRWGGTQVIDSQSDLSWQLGGFQRDKGLAGPAKFQSPDVRYGEDQLGLRLDYRRPGWVQDSTVVASYGYGIELDHYFDPRSQLGLGAQDNRYEHASHDLNLVKEVQLTRASHGLRVHLRQEGFISEERLVGRRQDDMTRQQVELGWDGSFFLLDGGLELRPSLSGLTSRDDFQNQQDHENQASWSLTGLKPLGKGFAMRAGTSRGVRVPGFSELFGDRGTVMGNPALVPERSMNYDLGLTWEGKLLQEGGEIVSEWVVFRSDRTHLIQMVFDSRGIGRPENLEEGKVEGLEWSLSAALPWGLRLGHNLTLQKARQKNPLVGGGKDLKIPGIFEEVVSPWLEWNRGPWKLRYDIFLASEKAYDIANNITAADQEEHGFALEYSKASWRVSGGITNLTDETLEDYNNWPRPGRAFFASTKFNF